MTATDEVCRQLDERGVEWWPLGNDMTECVVDDVRIKYRQVGRGLIVSTCTEGTVTPEQAIAATLGREVTGETSDGYHTFDELYHHRAVLFSIVVRDHAELAWKSKCHHDGTMYDKMFIVGIETPTGQATYHYDIDPYWEMFNCKELEQAPEWDGHTPADAIARIDTLGRGGCYDTGESRWFRCSECGFGMTDLYTDGGWSEAEQPKFCPNCGRKVVTDG